MTETATILVIKQNTAIVGCSASSHACESCAGNLFCSVKERTYEALIETGLSLEIGDTVRVYLPPGKTILSGFMVLILPLLLFILFYFLSGRLLSVESDGKRALFGLAGLCFGFLMAFICSRMNRKNNLPRIVRKISIQDTLSD